MTFRETVAHANLAVLDDGVVTLGETTLLLRLVRPFVLQGDRDAIELQKLLRQVRLDGVVTPEESATICRRLSKLADSEISLAGYVHEVIGYPRPGLRFRDVTGLLDNAEAFGELMDEFDSALADVDFSVVVAPETRGLIFGGALAARHRKSFAPVRVAGHLPRRAMSESFGVGSGRVTFQIHADAINYGEKVVLVDDVLTTGESLAAVVRLVEKLGGIVVKVLVPVEVLAGEARSTALAGYDVYSAIQFPV